MSARDLQTPDRQSSSLGVLARLWWMLIGNIVLAFSIVFILENKSGFFHAADWVFWITVATLVVVRYLDVKFFNGRTATDAPATMRHWVRYTIALAACSTTAWALAHVANHLFVQA